MLKPKVGDLVRLKPFKVTRLNSDYFECYGGTSNGYDSIEEILPRPLAVGDRVQVIRSEYPATGVILAVDKTAAWVCWEPNRGRTTEEIAGLKRVDEPS